MTIHPVSRPCVMTLHDPRTYTVPQLLRALAVAHQATESLGQRDGFVRGEEAGVLGVYGDRGVLVLAEAPGVPA